jgi:hypothetical protein
MEELEALLRYLVKHNEDHAAEITELADRARDLGKQDAYEHLVRGVQQLLESNQSLRAALTTLEVEDVSR